MNCSAFFETQLSRTTRGPNDKYFGTTFFCLVDLIKNISGRAHAEIFLSEVFINLVDPVRLSWVAPPPDPPNNAHVRRFDHRFRLLSQIYIECCIAVAF